MSDHAQPIRHREIRSVQELRQPFLFPFIRLRPELAEWSEIISCSPTWQRKVSVSWQFIPPYSTRLRGRIIFIVDGMLLPESKERSEAVKVALDKRLA
jgi:hypothetical protein